MKKKMFDVWVIMKDDESYGQELKEIYNSKKSADKRTKFLNENKSKLDAITGDFYVEKHAVFQENQDGV